MPHPPQTRSLSRSLLGAVLSLGSLLTLPSVRAQSPTAASAGCTLHDRVYTCNWDRFRTAFAAANTVALETQPLDRFTVQQLRQLVLSQAKSVAGTGQPADLTILLIPTENTGIQMGPSDKIIATLRIYAPGPGTTHGTLLWAETYTAQPDHPWPATVHSLVEQFQNRLQGLPAR